MSATVTKSFRLPNWVVKKIQLWSKEESLTQGQFLSKMISRYEIMMAEQEYERDASRMKKDKAYLQHEADLANEEYL